MGIGKDKLGNTYSIVYHDGTGNVRGATYASITTQGHLVLTDPGPVPTAPADGKLILFVEDHAGRVLPATIGPSGMDKTIQPALFGSTLYVWLPGTGATLAIAWGTTFTARNAGATLGAQSHPIKSNGSAMTSMNRASFTTTIAVASSGIQSTNTVAWLGNATGLGGFLFFARFGIENFTTGTYHALVGLSALNASLLVSDATGIATNAQTVNTIALGKEAADTTWQIITRSATTAGLVNGTNYNKINTSITITVGQILDLYIYSAPNSQSVRFQIKNAVTGADLYVSSSPITTAGTLPANSVFLYAHAQLQSTVGANTKILSLNTMYVECDL
jgi:hypothetical protein